MSWLRVAILLWVTGVVAPGAEFVLRWRDDRVEVVGLSAKAFELLKGSGWTPRQWQSLLAVYAEQGDAVSDINLPAVAGAYRVEKRTLIFEPAFPLAAGVRYSAVFRPQILGEKLAPMTATFRLEVKRAEPSTVVTAIYPSADVLPENLLKFYVHFSAPMSGGRIYEHISLRDLEGKEVELPFLEIDEELWNREMTRLTLFLDPGRIKRGVKPLEEIGPSFVAGKKYTLAIAQSWLDANGALLKAPFSKTFSIAPADREPPDPAQWKVTAPGARTRSALRVTFNEPLDHGILQRTLVVLRGKTRVPGDVKVLEGERDWTFAPEKAWEAGDYVVQVPTRIEDLAGNNVGKPFDMNLEEGSRPVTDDFVRVPFRVR